MRFIFDLDGTICTQQKSGEYEKALPLVHMLTRLRQLKNEGHTIVIYTARGMNTYKGDVSKVIECYSEMTTAWLVNNGVPYDELIFGKPAGDYYIDDKAMTLSMFRRTYDPEPLRTDS